MNLMECDKSPTAAFKGVSWPMRARERAVNVNLQTKKYRTESSTKWLCF